jgi:hypothetical protein
MELVNELKTYGVVPYLVRNLRSGLSWAKYKEFFLRMTKVAVL